MYTTIIHPIRKSLCLSVEEYVVLDTIYHLSNNEKYGHWCIMTKRRLAETLDMSESTIFRILKTLEAKELVARDENTGYVKTLDSFNEMIANKDDWIIGFKGKETAFLSGKTGLVCQNDSHTVKMTEGVCQNDSRGTVKMTDNIYKEINTMIDSTITEISIDTQLVEEFRGLFVGDIDVEIVKFLNYWNEPNQKRTKCRWQMEKTFEVKRRLITWMDRSGKITRKNSNEYYMLEFKKLGGDVFAHKFGVDLYKKFNKQING